MTFGFALVLLAITSTRSCAATTNRAWNSSLTVGGSEIDINVDRGGLEPSHEEILKWVHDSACAVATYYGRFPVKELRLVIVPIAGRKGVLNGKTWGYHGALTRVLIGQFTTPEELNEDWVLTHEMVHLAFPSVAESHHWIEEGIATYVEPIARVEVGNLEPSSVWQQLVQGLPKGLPQPGDEGLDYTHTWGRTYWGGALFCLLADVDIRQATGNKYGLQDALRAIVAAGGNIEIQWPLPRVLRVADKAVGVPVLARLYNQMKAAPIEPSLPALWRQLGIEPAGASVSFNNHAPLGSLRQAITSAPASSPGCDSAGLLRGSHGQLSERAASAHH